MSERRTYKLRELVLMRNGKKRPPSQGDYPVYGGNGIMGYVREYNAENVIIVGRVGAYCGNVYKSDNKCWVSDNAIEVFAKDSVDRKYLYYLMLNLDFHHYHIGGAQPLITQDIIGDFEIHLPPLAEQKRIAAILGALDDKIELNRRINANLEEQAKALFKEWFIDTSRSTDQVGVFKDVILTTLSGDWGQETPKGGYFSEVYCIRGADIPDIKQGAKGKMPTRYILEKNLLKKRLSANDLVIEISGGSPSQSTGRVCLITHTLLDRLGKDVICTNFCRAIKPMPEYALFVYLYWQYLYDNNTMFSYENGTTGIKNLNINDLIEKEQINIPSLSDVERLNAVLNPVYDRIFTNGLQNEKLAALRDTLLPKLMNGEILR